ncbi:MAG TPA: hypothetical protein VKV17_06940 [Bryobacteraceae bacterium]|nr:hypothetical protein [Bryobacteraceae bacterium]
MTKIDIHFRLQRPLEEAELPRISDLYAIYGIQKIRMDPNMEGITVEYDATRLRPAEVESALASAGIPLALAEA